MKNLYLILSLCITLPLCAQKTYEHSSHYAIDPEGNLFLESEDAQVRISGEDRDNVAVEIYREIKGKDAGDDFSVHFRAEGGDLYIEEHMSRSGLIGWNTDIRLVKYTIDIRVPRGVSLNITGEDDDYEIASVDGDIRLRSEDGDIRLYNCRGKNKELDIEDGDLNAQGLMGDLKISGEDGDIHLEQCSLGQLDIRAEDGSLHFPQGSVNGVQLKFSDGDIVLPEVTGSLKIKNEDGDIRIQLLKAIESDISTDDGDVNIALDAQPNGRYNIKTSDGDIVIAASGEGAEYEISLDDGDLDFPESRFRYTTDKDHYKVLRSIPDGKAFVRIMTQDGDIRLKSN